MIRWATTVLLLAACAPVASQAQQTPAWSLDARQRLLAGPPGQRDQELAERQQLLAQGEARLAAGDADGARSAFERASQLLHAADTEQSLVRAFMQAGDYRQALAFAAHAAGAHRDAPAGTALYAWLLHVGGQGRYAERTLADALQLTPDDDALRAARTAWSGAWPLADGVLAAGPARTLPYAWGALVPNAATAVGSALLLADGQSAWVPTALLAGAQRVWVRNGLGEAAEAAVDLQADAALPAIALPAALSLLRWSKPLPRPAELTPPARQPYAGSPAYLLEYATGPGNSAAWPLMRQGFFGRTAADGGLNALNISTQPGPGGGVVFDAAGHVLGVAITDPQGREHWWPLATTPSAGAAAPPAPRMPVDALYESGLRVALQVIVQR